MSAHEHGLNWYVMLSLATNLLNGMYFMYILQLHMCIIICHSYEVSPEFPCKDQEQLCC